MRDTAKLGKNWLMHVYSNQIYIATPCDSAVYIYIAYIVSVRKRSNAWAYYISSGVMNWAELRAILNACFGFKFKFVHTLHVYSRLSVCCMRMEHAVCITRSRNKWLIMALYSIILCFLCAIL